MKKFTKLIFGGTMLIVFLIFAFAQTAPGTTLMNKANSTTAVQASNGGAEVCWVASSNDVMTTSEAILVNQTIDSVAIPENVALSRGTANTETFENAIQNQKSKEASLVVQKVSVGGAEVIPVNSVNSTFTLTSSEVSAAQNQTTT